MESLADRVLSVNSSINLIFYLKKNMTIDPKLGKLKYNSQNFTFRNEGSIKFPKSGSNDQFGRDNCYELAVDIVVVSTTQEQYRNFKSTPAHGFFGYASIVTQDCLLEPIPIKFARQRIYQEKVVEAYQSWQDLAVYLANTKKWFELLESVITQGAANSPTIKNICEIEAYSARWTELSIREVYIELPKDSEFRIELVWVSPESFTDGCGKLQDGKSKQPIDPKKDSGLPKSGIQPKINTPANPFAGNPPLNGAINDSRFANPITSLDNPDPNNTFIDPFEPRSYSVTATGAFWNGTGTTNLFQQTLTVDSLGASIPPFRAISTFQQNLNGDPSLPLFFVKVVDSENRQVNFGACFNGQGCVRIGIFDGSITWS